MTVPQRDTRLVGGVGDGATRSGGSESAGAAGLILAVESTGEPIAPLVGRWLADPDPLPRLTAALVDPEAADAHRWRGI